jgi:nitrogen fixation protein NifU and related proteins
MNLQSLYQELILQHYRSPRNRGELEEPDAEILMNNPVCGDEITLRLKVAGDRIEKARFTGQGCSISQASASMMTQQLEGKTLEEARALSSRFTQMMHGDAGAASDRALGDLRALAGVAKFPVRIKCALLPWNALSEASRSLGLTGQDFGGGDGAGERR